MPISKRDKKVSLTKTTKKGMKLKQHVVEDIRKSLEEFTNLFVFNMFNMRTGPMSELRESWKGSRFFLAKRKVMAVALGRTPDTEVKKNLHKVAAYMAGDCGLLFTNEPKHDVVKWFKKYSKMDYAKSGFIPSETVVLPKGPLNDFSFSIEPHLRSLGLPTELQKGVIMLREDYTVCQTGSKLTAEQAQILKLIEKPLTEFKVRLVCVWSQDGSFEKFKFASKIEKSESKSTPNTSHKKLKNQENAPPNEDSNGATDVTELQELTISEKTPERKRKISNDHKPHSNSKNLQGQVVKTPVTHTESSHRRISSSSFKETDTMDLNKSPFNKTDLQKSREKKETPKQKNNTIKTTDESEEEEMPEIQEREEIPESQEEEEVPESQEEEEIPESQEEELMQVDPSPDMEEEISKPLKDKTPVKKHKTPEKTKTPETVKTPAKNKTPETAKSPEKTKTPEKSKIIDQTLIKDTNPHNMPTIKETEVLSSEPVTTAESEEVSESEKEEGMQTEPSPKLGKGNPRRSLRTPKPLKRTPEQRRLSLKKLTTSKATKTASSTPSETKGTPKKSVETPRLGTPRQAKGTPKQTRVTPVKATPTRQSTRRVSKLLKLEEESGDIEMS